MSASKEMVSKAIESLIGEKTHLDLNNYFPKHHSFNSVVYFHKKFLAKHSGNSLKPDENKVQSISKNIPSEKVAALPRNHKINEKYDKVQINNKDPHSAKEKRKHKEMNESLVQQTIKFAKDIVPLILPPSVDGSQEAYYTVKSVKPKKAPKKEKSNIAKAQKEEYIDAKSCIETFRKDTCFRESSTAMETTSRMSSLQELKISESLNCSLSEISNRPNKNRHHSNRENITNKTSRQETTKLVASESLQALADGLNQSTSRGNQIKLHVMTDQDKILLTEGVHNAVIRAVRDCIEEIIKCKGSGKELITVEKTIKYNSDKLDNILDRLTNLEISIANAVKEQTYIKPIDTETKVLLKHNAKANASTLEQLGEDLLEQDILEAEDNVETFNSYDTRQNAHNLEPIRVQTLKTKSDIGNQGCGEEIPRAGTSSTDQIDIRQERTNRIPTRYCWTDVNSRPNRR